MTDYVVVTSGEAGPQGPQGPQGAPGGVTDQHGELQGLGDNDHPQYLLVVDIDDAPVDGVVNAPISSNWAFDHLAAADPHPGYLTPAEGNAAYDPLGAAVAAIVAHEAAADPHPQYLTLAEGNAAFIDSAELAAAIAAHEAAVDPHPQYTTAAELAAAIGAIDHGALTGLADNDHPQYLLVADIDDAPVDGAITAPISSNWAFDHLAAADPHPGYTDAAELAAAIAAHEAAADPHPTYTTAAELAAAIAAIDHGALLGLADNDHPQYLLVADIDDTPVDGELAQPISSNWAFDHLAAADPHPGYTTAAELSAAVTPFNTFDIQFTMVAGFNGDITLLQHASFAFTILAAWFKTASGTITANVKIDGTSVTGLSALALTSVEDDENATAANSVAVGNTVSVTTTVNATAVNASLMLSCARV